MIYKGCCKKMIVLKNTGNDLFDEAYFVLNDKNTKSYTASESDMIKEANKIISNDLLSGYFSRSCTEDKRSRSSGKGRSFLIGLLTGIAVCGIVLLIFK